MRRARWPSKSTTSASTGNGMGTHLAFAEFNHMAGVDMVGVPYKGGSRIFRG